MGEARLRASGRYSKAREEQDADEAKRRRREIRRRPSEVKPFRFKEVRRTKSFGDERTERRAGVLYGILMCAVIAAITVFVMCAFFRVRTVSCTGVKG